MSQPEDRYVPDGDMSIQHELKCWPQYFERIVDGTKTFEVRKDDRGFQQHDTVLLREYDPHTDTYSGREARATVGYVLRESCAAIADLEDHVVFSLLNLWHPEMPF